MIDGVHDEFGGRRPLSGTAVRAQIDPTVRTVIEELGLDPDEEFARPVTDEVLRGADVIVTMGHSVGAIDLPDGVRHEDWRVGDPIGAPLTEIRRVRDDIEYRVRALLGELGVLGADASTLRASRRDRACRADARTLRVLSA